MGIIVIYELTCHCGGTATSSSLDMSNPFPDGTMHVDIALAAECATFDCRQCGCSIFTGDLDIMTEPDECRGDEDEEDEDEDGDEGEDGDEPDKDDE